jgi:hypothetical protein
MDHPDYRAALAQPESDEVTPAEIYRLIEEVDQKGLARPGLVRAALARWGRPAIQPVTVAERPWESEGWCDADGECWWCPQDGPPYWQMANPAMVYGGWLLPHHALPIPQPTSTP